MAAGAKRRRQHLPPAMCWGDLVTPHCPRSICPPQRGKTCDNGTWGALRPRQLPADAMGMWVPIFGGGR